MKDEFLQDKISEYLKPFLSEYVFDELSSDFIKRQKENRFLKGVSIPLKLSELAAPMSNVLLAKNMMIVLGIDPNFKYKDNYISYIKASFSNDFIKALLNDGIKEAQSENYLKACIYFRAALLLDDKNLDALYYYARACLDAYKESEDYDFIGNFKAESLHGFERLTILHQDFDMGYYYLTYAYLNLGLYTKAMLTANTFLELTENIEAREEINELIDKLQEPIKIEAGYNKVLSGRFEEGISILEPYKDDKRFNTWWPLWYYIGISYKNIADYQLAIDHFLKALSLSPSNIQVMQELVVCYEAVDNQDLVKKYKGKIALLESYEEK